MQTMDDDADNDAATLTMDNNTATLTMGDDADKDNAAADDNNAAADVNNGTQTTR